MPSTSRRALLAALGSGVVGGLAGCSAPGTDEAPAGSLRFANEHTVPHLISVRVTGVGSEPGAEPGAVRGDPIVPPEQRTLSAAETVAPGESTTYESVFTEAAYYAVEFRVDGARPENGGPVVYRPTADDRAGDVLVGRVYESGEFSWVVSATDDPGRFG